MPSRHKHQFEVADGMSRSKTVHFFFWLINKAITENVWGPLLRGFGNQARLQSPENEDEERPGSILLWCIKMGWGGGLPGGRAHAHCCGSCVWGVGQTEKGSPSFSRNFCSTGRNKTLPNEISSIPQILIEKSTMSMKSTLFEKKFENHCKWYAYVNETRQSILYVLLWDTKPQNARNALIRKDFQKEVTVGSCLQWLPPQGSLRRGLLLHYQPGCGQWEKWSYCMSRSFQCFCHLLWFFLLFGSLWTPCFEKLFCLIKSLCNFCDPGLLICLNWFIHSIDIHWTLNQLD